MRKFTFKTGRVYDTEQVLDCEVIEENADGDTLLVKVIDMSRGMKFQVNLYLLSEHTVLSDYYLGTQVLRLYDKGAYI